jgi:hypothetical protein
VFRLEADVASATLTQNAVGQQREIGFGGAADAAEMRNRFAFAILTFS